LEAGAGWPLNDTIDCRAVVDWMLFKPGLSGALSSLFPLYCCPCRELIRNLLLIREGIKKGVCGRDQPSDQF